MESAAPFLTERLAHESEQKSVSGGHLFREQLEEKGIVSRLHGFVVAEGELKLWIVVLAVEGLDPESQTFGDLPDLFYDSVRINFGAGAVHVGPVGVDGLPTAVAVRLKQVGLKFKADVHLVAKFSPVGYGFGESGPRGDGHGFAVFEEIRYDYAGVWLPRLAHVCELELSIHVAESLKEVGTGCARRHLAVVAK